MQWLDKIYACFSFMDIRNIIYWWMLYICEGLSGQLLVHFVFCMSWDPNVQFRWPWLPCALLDKKHYSISVSRPNSLQPQDWVKVDELCFQVLPILTRALRWTSWPWLMVLSSIIEFIDCTGMLTWALYLVPHLSSIFLILSHNLIYLEWKIHLLNCKV